MATVDRSITKAYGVSSIHNQTHQYPVVNTVVTDESVGALKVRAIRQIK